MKAEEDHDPPTTEEVEEVVIDPSDRSKVVRIGMKLSQIEKEKMIEFLTANRDRFAWKHSDLSGIDPSVACHSLNADPKVAPTKQKQRRFPEFKNQVVSEEVDRLLEAGFIREVEYADWISNVVVVGKKNGKWRMCVDFINLNKACPKDDYPVPKIDQKVDATAGYELLSFLDAYSGYNQIPLLESDQLKTCFTCERGLYCYKLCLLA